jgi:hypothetical protein
VAAISFSLPRGADDMKISSFTVGTLAPNANDFEFRYNTTDALGKAVTKLDLVKALEAFRRAVEQQGTTVNITNAPPL